MDESLERAYDRHSMPPREDDELEDRELMARAQGGDRSAFDELVRRHESALHAYARRCLGDPLRAAEATQDAFVRAYTYRASYKPEAGSVKGWLLGVAANRVRDALRAKREAPRPIDEAFAVAASTEEGLAAFERVEVRESVGRALDELEPEHREVLALRYASELPFEEVARILGITLGAAKMRAARARDILARRLAHLVDSRSAERGTRT
jgi:RNA polymerase sigma-70 factor (ECF subfamily)